MSGIFIFDLFSVFPLETDSIIDCRFDFYLKPSVHKVYFNLNNLNFPLLFANGPFNASFHGPSKYITHFFTQLSFNPYLPFEIINYNIFNRFNFKMFGKVKKT